MKTKQLIAFVVAAAIFVVTGVTSVAINTWATNTIASKTSLWEELMSDDTVETPLQEYIAVVEVEGTIYSQPTTSMFGETAGYNHPATMNYVDQLMEDELNKGILLYMNTPGGEVTASDEMYLKLMEYKEKTGRKIYCYYGDQSCSGGYYISMAADEIYADRNCWTGSIGVIVSLSNMQGLYEKLGIEEINITSGRNKAMGSAGSELTEEQRNILQSLVDESYEQFVDIIEVGRGLSESRVKELGDGRIYTAKQALEVDLIDGISTWNDYCDKVLAEVGEDVMIFEREENAYDFASLFATLEELQPKSDAQVISEMLEKENMGGLMYYADIVK